MTHNDFQLFLDLFLGNIIEILGNKAEYYSSDNDRLHNFKRAAQIDDITPEEALRGMQLKHRTAIADFIDRDKLTDTPLEEWQEKIIDTVNYYILLLAMVEEAFKKEEYDNE